MKIVTGLPSCHGISFRMYMGWAINLYGLNFRYFYEMQNMSRNTFCEIFSLDVFTGNFTTKMLTMAFYRSVTGYVKPSLDVTA